MSMVLSPLKLNFDMTRPLCDMQLGSPCQLAEVEFRVVTEHISTRDLVQKYLAYKTFPTSVGWGMPKKKDEGKKFELVRLLYRFKFHNTFSGPCAEWLEVIEKMCNEILRNYTKKEDQLMTAVFGTREKRRLNQVMDALGFEYPNYDRLDEEAEGVKKKRVVSILKRQVQRSIEKDKKKRLTKKPKLTPEPSASKKRKIISSSHEEEERSSPPKHFAETPSETSISVIEILEVMTEPLPFTMLSPLGSELTSLLQPQKKDARETVEVEAEKGPSAPGGGNAQKKRHMMNVMRVVLDTPPPSIQKKIAPYVANEGPQQAESNGGPIRTTLSEIDRLIANIAPEKNIEGSIATETSASKGKRTEEASSEDKSFNLQHLRGQQLSEEHISKLKEFVVSGGYQPGSVLFGGIDEEILGCICDRLGQKL
jgi:hypothetical protein